MTKRQINKNKGEWSKIYVFLKFLTEDNIKSENFNYPIINVNRNDLITIRDNTPSNKVKIRDQNNGSEINDIPIDIIRDISSKMYEEIKKGKKSFPIPLVDNFLNSYKIQNLAKTTQLKKDITITFRNIDNKFEKEIDFLIKSKLGSDPTFFNASQGSNIVFRIKGIDLKDNHIQEINKMKNNRGKTDVKGRINWITSNGGQLEFVNLDKKIFYNNLVFIDKDLPQIIAEIVLEYYKGKVNSLDQLINIVRKKNPCNFELNTNQKFYENKIKRFLTHAYLGMTASKIWKEAISSENGIIIVEKDGNISCYHGFLRSDFQDYIFYNSRIDTPDSKRNKYAVVYQNNSESFIKLNFQIRWNI